MPDFLVHMIFGNTIIDKETSLIEKMMKNKMYNFGLMGPDPFFYNYKNKSYKKTGTLLHNERKEEFIKGLKEIDENYYNGYRCHLYLDDIFHPLIEKLGPDSRSHKAVEVKLDDEFGKRFLNKGLGKINFIEMFPEILDEKFIAEYNTLLKNVYGLNDVDISKAHKSFINNMVVLYKNFYLKAIFFKIMKFISIGKIDYAHFYPLIDSKFDLLEKKGFGKLWEKAQDGVKEV